MLRTARFAGAFLGLLPQQVSSTEVTLDIGGEPRPATLYRPVGTDALVGRSHPPARRLRHPGWILLHGLTVPGRRHPGLCRFARALASSGAAVLIPEVPAWRDLRIDPGAADPTIIAAAAHLADRPDVAGDRSTLVGFSFGATQALVSAARPHVGAGIGKVIAFGGYADLERTMLAMMTGEQEWQGRRRCLEPDPYGRWIAAANYLTLIPEYAQMHALAAAAKALAVESGVRGAYAGDEEYDGLKAALREGLSLEARELWDLLAPPFGVRASPGPAQALARRLARAALERHPELDPRERLGGLVQSVVLAHGYDDRLIPSSETLRLRELLPRPLEASLCITRLFSHSREADPLPLTAYPREFASFCKLLNRALSPR